jgi:hypothetical protein
MELDLLNPREPSPQSVVRTASKTEWMREKFRLAAQVEAPELFMVAGRARN